MRFQHKNRWTNTHWGHLPKGKTMPYSEKYQQLADTATTLRATHQIDGRMHATATRMILKQAAPAAILDYLNACIRCHEARTKAENTTPGREQPDAKKQSDRGTARIPIDGQASEEPGDTTQGAPQDAGV